MGATPPPTPLFSLARGGGGGATGWLHCPFLFSLLLKRGGTLHHLVSFGLNLVSQAFEFHAGAFASKLGYESPLCAGLIKLQEEKPLSNEH